MSAVYPRRATPVSVHMTPSASRVRLVDVRYRSVATLLFAYASRLSRGELFLETARPFSPGTRLLLRLQAPVAAALKLAASVVWARPIALGPGEPSGMGIALSASIESQGAVIDDLASRFRGIRVLVAGSRAAARAGIARYLRSILACDVVDISLPTDLGLLAKDIDARLDLAFVDLDDERHEGAAVIRVLKDSARTTGLPVVALAAHEQDRASAAALGADEVLATPPAFSDMRTVVMYALSSPTNWSSD